MQKALVFLSPGFPGNEAETDCLPPVQNFVKALARRNPALHIHVIAFQYPFMGACYPWHGVTVHAVAGGNKRFPFRLASWFHAAREAKKLMTTYDVLALHSLWLAECSYVASWLRKASRTKHIASIQGQDALPGNPYLRRLPFKKMIVTAVSSNAAEAFSRSTGRRVDYVIPTGIDPESLATTEWPPRSIDILGVGSLTALKNFQLFVEIVAKLHATRPSLRCVIVGEGPERTSLKQQIAAAAVSNIVELHGHVPREEVLRMMRQSRILLHTASFEGQGYVFMEALACGMRVVSFDVGYAGMGPSVYRCKSAEELLSVLQQLLSSELGEVHTAVDTIDDTVTAFEALYGIRS